MDKNHENCTTCTKETNGMESGIYKTSNKQTLVQFGGRIKFDVADVTEQFDASGHPTRVAVFIEELANPCKVGEMVGKNPAMTGSEIVLVFDNPASIDTAIESLKIAKSVMEKNNQYQQENNTQE